MLDLMGRKKLLFAYSAMILVECKPPAGQPPETSGTEPASATDAAPPFPPEETSSSDTQTPEPATVEAQPVEPGVTRTNVPTRGTLPKSVVQEKLNSAAPGIKACYERSLKAKPDLAGNLSIDFVVAEDGTVAHAEAREVDQPLDDAKAVECILGEIRKLEFPKPNGGRVFLNYPLGFWPPKPEP